MNTYFQIPGRHLALKTPTLVSVGRKSARAKTRKDISSHPRTHSEALDVTGVFMQRDKCVFEALWALLPPSALACPDCHCRAHLPPTHTGRLSCHAGPPSASENPEISSELLPSSHCLPLITWSHQSFLLPSSSGLTLSRDSEASLGHLLCDMWLLPSHNQTSRTSAMGSEPLPETRGTSLVALALPCICLDCFSPSA